MTQTPASHASTTTQPPIYLEDLTVGDQFTSGETSKKMRLLQDVFLSSVRNSEVQVTMFLVNGVMLQGRIAAYDLFCMLLEREGYVQLAYKHAVSTIQPVTPVDLTGEADDDSGDHSD